MNHLEEARAEAFLKRGVKRVFGFDPTEAICNGEIPASRPGKRKLIILRRDVEDYLASRTVRRASDGITFDRAVAQKLSKRIRELEDLCERLTLLATTASDHLRRLGSGEAPLASATTAARQIHDYLERMRTDEPR